MIQGRVVGFRQALLPLTVEGPNGHAVVDCTVDTGFTGSLALPAEGIAALGLSFLRDNNVRMADGKIVPLREYEITVQWHDAPRLATVIEKPGKPLLGMALLRDYLLTVEIWEGGAVTVTPRSGRAMGDTSTLADPTVVAGLKEKYADEG